MRRGEKFGEFLRDLGHDFRHRIFAIAKIAAELAEQKRITPSLLQSVCIEGKELFEPVELTLKGKEAPLPNGINLTDKDGHVRTQSRVRWYLSPVGQTYRKYALTDNIDCDLPLEAAIFAEAEPYPATAKPVFVGHYWLSASRPEILADNVACVDFSVAKVGFLCAYRWNGEQKLSNKNFVWIA